MSRARHMVATSQTAAVDAGLSILDAGGNAADAAVATAAALAVTEPCSNGLGGDCFALFFDGATGAITALNGSGRSPAALTLDRLARERLARELPSSHAHTVTVPGAVRGWFDLVERHGSRPMAQLLAPAIQLARDGFAVGPITAHHWAAGARARLARSPHRNELLIDGHAPRAGERFCNPTLAATLDEIAAHGPDAFYSGRIAGAIVAAVSDAGGALAADDLADHRSTWDEPIAATYRDVRVHECPPNGQGLAVLIALGVLRSLPGDRLGEPGSFARAHHVIEALRLAFTDTLRYVADPAFAAVPVGELLSAESAGARAAAIDPLRAMHRPQPISIGASDTVYLTVVDSSGNACSFIQSNYQGFGTGLIPAGCGFSLQNRGANFSLDPDHPNALGPRKRPYHTIIPALATRADGSLYASFGVMGGFMQPQGQVQVLLALIDDGLDPQAALDRPRLFVDPFSGQVALEHGTPDQLAAQLAAAGHPVRVVDDRDRALFGRGQIIRTSAAGLEGGSDRRADGRVGAR